MKLALQSFISCLEIFILIVDRVCVHRILAFLLFHLICLYLPHRFAALLDLLDQVLNILSLLLLLGRRPNQLLDVNLFVLYFNL